MDANKAAKLAEIGYEIASCGLCQHGQFEGDSLWGTCAKFTYEHLKHTDTTRQVSVHSAGNCPSFTIFDPIAGVDKPRPFPALGPFAGFVRGRQET